MLTRIGLCLSLCSLGLAPVASAQESAAPPPFEQPPTDAPPPSDQPPAELPPPPPPELPAPPQPEAEPAPPPEVEAPPPAAIPDGQWVFTSQYGWVFMPYEQAYTYVPAYGDPFMFVFYPTYGWRWLRAPWVFGVGPRPYWGSRGYVRFAWHAHPWFVRRGVVMRAPPARGGRVYVHGGHAGGGRRR
jgi:hypothetical protein